MDNLLKCWNSISIRVFGREALASDTSAAALKARALKEFSIPHGKHEGLEIRKISMKTDHKDEKHGVQKLSLGQRTSKPTKAILLVGATGAGKTTLINNMVNYIFRVEFEDHFRLILIDDKDAEKKSQAMSQTDLITAYFFNHINGMPFDYNYVLVDTPGFGDTRGIARVREMMCQLEEFFKQSYGIDSVDGVGIVTTASAARLTHTQRYVYEGLTSMFGKDIKKNIYVLVTFADAKTPPVLEALNNANVEYSGFYKFNNSALYARNKADKTIDEDCDSAHICELYWGMGYRNIENFFIKLGRTSPASLTLTKEVLKERRELQTVVVGLQAQIHIGLDKLNILQIERDMLNQASANMQGAQNYEQEVDVPRMRKINVKQGRYVTNCTLCNNTCHSNCKYFDNNDKIKCSAMSDGFCQICVKKCKWDMHINNSFRFDVSYVKEKRTLQQLYDRYKTSAGDKLSKEQAVKAIENDINKNANNLVSMIQKAQKHVERLEKIALKPNPLSTKEYIELMTESEKMQKKHNFEKRIKILVQLKKEVQVLQGLKGQPNTSSGVEVLKYFRDMMSSN